ncbi:hypothetical protein SAMN05216388_103628 [Halorientalis persicus]|jgi:hypothetical protein|uniref:Uncharacterized protein n=1 Tax=Halorientalis persicus TaxID=1367881 RepID=A0A1H8VE26_9EURY|nr:hypothetical protein [Halorientalis persicus]SEP13696.1 hypothetical protein SAMN05216388_103628 [Halorientalis persicus]
MRRHETTVEDETVYVETDDGRVEVGALDRIVDAVGGHAWTIEYSDWEKEYYDDLDTSDEGMIVDVVDMTEALTHGESFVEMLRTHPSELTPSTVGEGDSEAETGDETDLSPRMGLFVGKLLENLESGLD